MLNMFAILSLGIALAWSAISMACGLFYRLHVKRWRKIGEAGPPVSVLKPLCGGDDLVHKALRTFCEQDYPEFELLFGVAPEDRDAILMVERLKKEYPEIAIDICFVDRLVHGNQKVASLETLSRKAKYDILLCSDSDISVSRVHLSAIVAQLLQDGVGAVTCPYIGVPSSNVWSSLGSMWINLNFTPCAVVSKVAKIANGCFGSTIAMRRSTLQKIGGFKNFHNQLADDYAIGVAVMESGAACVMAPIFAETIVEEASFSRLWSHELRWQRTIRSLAPAGHCATIATHSLMWALTGLVASGFASWAMTAAAAAFAARLAYAWIVVSVYPGTETDFWLLPVRDILTFAVFTASLFGNRVHWRGRVLTFSKGGVLHP